MTHDEGYLTPRAGMPPWILSHSFEQATWGWYDLYSNSGLFPRAHTTALKNQLIQSGQRWYCSTLTCPHPEQVFRRQWRLHLGEAFHRGSGTPSLLRHTAPDSRGMTPARRTGSRAVLRRSRSHSARALVGRCPVDHHVID